MPGSFAAPQAGQVCSSGAAHAPQNRRPALFSVPQLGQVIEQKPTAAAVHQFVPERLPPVHQTGARPGVGSCAMETERLAVIPLFGGLDGADLEAIAAAATEVEAAEGQTLVTEGDFGHALYAIESGTADVNANDATVVTLGPGDVFGEMAVLASGRRTATVVATSPMQLIAFFKPAVWALERKAPEAVERLRALIAERRASNL
jgi:hypothetical protein